MTAPAAILAVLLAHAPWSDRHLDTDQRIAILRPVAEAIADASETRADAAMLLALGWHESSFATAVVRGSCRPNECDHGAARGAFQLHVEACPEAYAYEAGSVESIRLEADCALRLLRYHARRCHSVRGAFAGYGTGNRCQWAGANARVVTAHKRVEELRAVEAGQ